MSERKSPYATDRERKVPPAAPRGGAGAVRRRYSSDQSDLSDRVALCERLANRVMVRCDSLHEMIMEINRKIENNKQKGE